MPVVFGRLVRKVVQLPRGVLLDAVRAASGMRRPLLEMRKLELASKAIPNLTSRRTQPSRLSLRRVWSARETR